MSKLAEKEADGCFNCASYRESGPHKYKDGGPNNGDEVPVQIICKKYSGFIAPCTAKACKLYKQMELAA